MELRSHSSRDEEALIAERAAEWLLRAKGADAREKERLLNWLCRSPQNGGELLAATSMDVTLRHYFRDKHIDVEQFLAASANVLTVGEHPHSPPAPARAARSPWFAAAGLGGAAAAFALVVTPTPVRTWLYPCEYVASAAEQRVIDLAQGSAIAINVQSGALLVFSANAREVYLNGGQAMFAAAKSRAGPVRARVMGDPKAGKGTVIHTLGADPGVAHREERNAAGIGVLASFASTDQPAVGAWLQSNISFSDDALEMIAAAFRECIRAPWIRVQSDGLCMQRFSAMFDVHHPEALLIYFPADSSMVVEHGGDNVLIR